MRYLLTIVLAVAAACPAICQVTGAEYYIDNDPGYRNATSVTVTAGNDITKSFTVPLASVTNGFHIVGVRAKDAQGHWSLTQLHSFYVLTAAATNITATEYYVDTDPGYGKAKAVTATIGADSSLKFVVPLTSYSKGFHTLGIRSKDNAGRWSQTQMRIFVIYIDKTPVNITSIQYFFTGTSATDSIYTYTVTEPSPTVDLNFTADLSQLQGNTAYDMHIIAISSEGSHSEEVIKHITVCNGDPAKAKFTYAVQGNQVSFTNNSVAGNNFEWNFGDTKTDTVKNPFHVYDSVGIYPVKLIASNACNSDTTIDTLNIIGLKSIYTNVGGNTGSVTVDIRGAGFDSSTKIYLHKDGQLDILSDTTPFIQNSGLLTTTFNLTNKVLGLWDVVGVFANGKRDTLHNGFTIETGCDPKLWVNMTGDGVLRVGFNQIYTVTYGNDGCTDAIFVPLLIKGLPAGTNIELLNPVFDVSTLSAFNTVTASNPPLNPTIIDTASNTAFRLFYLPSIPSGTTQTLQFIFHLPDTVTLHSYARPEIVIGSSQPTTTVSGNGGESHEFDAAKYAECAASIFELAGSLLLPSGHDVTECVSSYSSTMESAVTEIIKKQEGKPNQPVDGWTLNQYSVLVGGYNTLFSCGKLFIKFVPAVKVISKIVNITDLTLQGLETIQTCNDALKSSGIDLLALLIGNAWDPNSKYGSGDSSSKHYIDSIPLSYSINFENDTAANLNAQTVTVLDTLNKSYYNYSTFGFTSVTVGDSVYLSSSPTTSFIHDFDFTAQYGVKARVTATFDTATGIAQWKFLSIDPITNQTTTNALAGFLPPDVNSPQGQGYVSFIVRQNSNLKTGDTAHNRATIVFDYNPAITTNSWQNVFDYIAPASKVKPLPAEENDTTFNVQWSGTDNLSGIRSYDVYYSMNGGAYQLWLSDVSATDSNFTGEYDSTYSFYSIATDNAGNVEPAKTTAEATTHITGGVLAAKSSPLTGTLNANHTVSLAWKTYTETNNKGFNVERNTGDGWKTIGFIAGIGNNSSTKQYSFIDSNVTSGKIYYYRYKQIDNDGHSVYSNEIAIQIIGNHLLSMSVAPNPFKNQTSITYSLPVSGHVLLRLFDYNGKVVSTITNTDIAAGLQTKIFNQTGNLTSGVYVLRLETQVGIITNKVVIVK